MSNTILQKEGLITGDFVFNIGSKSDAIKKYAEQNGYDLSRCIAVGDGVHDIQMFETVGYSIAINPAKPVVGEAADEVVMNKDFNKVVSIILGKENN
jgi:hypothetical protein